MSQFEDWRSRIRRSVALFPYGSGEKAEQVSGQGLWPADATNTALDHGEWKHQPAIHTSSDRKRPIREWHLFQGLPRAQLQHGHLQTHSLGGDSATDCDRVSTLRARTQWP